jgi:hypothetical protein
MMQIQFEVNIPKQFGSFNIWCLILDCEKCTLANGFQKKLNESQNPICIQSNLWNIGCIRKDFLSKLQMNDKPLYAYNKTYGDIGCIK